MFYQVGLWEKHLTKVDCLGLDFFLGSHCLAMLYEHNDWQIVADRETSR